MSLPPGTIARIAGYPSRRKVTPGDVTAGSVIERVGEVSALGVEADVEGSVQLGSLGRPTVPAVPRSPVPTAVVMARILAWRSCFGEGILTSWAGDVSTPAHDA
jgi:hypothetical protein